MPLFLLLNKTGEDLYREEGKGIKQEYWEQEPPALRSDVVRAIRQTASHKATEKDSAGFVDSKENK